MSEHDDDKVLLDRAKRLFDESLQDVDGQTQSRLNRGRQKALQELQSRPGISVLGGWAPAAGVTAAAVIAVAMWHGDQPSAVTAPTSSATDFEILLNEDNLEMLEDLEFYSWLELDVDGNVG